MRNGVVGLAGTSAAGDERMRRRRNRCHRRCGRGVDAPVADHAASTTARQRGAGDDPDGTYSRVVVREDAIAAGFDPELVDKYLEADGELPMAYKVAGDRWTHFVTNDSGIAETGDIGTASYDDEGHWVTVGEARGARVRPGVGVVAGRRFADARPLSPWTASDRPPDDENAS